MKLVNIHNSRRQIYLFCRDDKGNLIIDEKDDFFPYFYEKDSEGTFKTIDGQLAKKIFVSEPSDVPKTRSMDSYEADILFTKRYMIDRIKQLDKCPIKYSFIDIEVLADELPNVQEALYPISCISVYNSFTKEIKTWYLGDYGDYDGKTYALSIADREKLLIKDFIDYMHKEKFDLWLSWYVGFDYNYLYNRIESIKNYGKKNFGELISPINKSRYGDGEVYYPAGISIVDYLQWDKKVTLNRRKSYELDNVAQGELKDEPNEKIEFGKLNSKIKEKNIRDIERMVKLEEKLKYIDYFDEIRRLTKVEWEDMIWNSRIIDMLLLQEAMDKKIVLPMKPAEERGTLTEKEEYQGAYRDVFKTGRISPVGVYDIGSAYPSMITNFCLDPANICTVPLDSKTKEGDIRIQETVFRQNPDTLLPIVVKKIMTIKNNIKNELSKCPLNSEQHKRIKIKYDAIKSVVNSAYGVFGLRFFRLFKKEVASATTFLVRDLLHYVQDKLEKQGYEIIYIDTDSIMINNNSDDISSTLNDYVKQWAKEKYNKTVDVEFEYKGYFDPIILLTKCRYKGWLVTDKGIEEKTKGIEAKRKDSTTYMKKFQTELLDKIKNKEIKENIFKWIKEEIKQLPNQQLKDVAFPCKLGRPIEKYKNVPIFVRALNNTPNFKKKVGNNFYYIFVKPDGYEEQEVKKNLIMTYDKNGNKKEFKNFTLNRLNKVTEITNMDLRRESDGEELTEDERLEKLKKQGLYKSAFIKIKGKPKDVKAFDEDNNYITKDMVNWDMIIKRNVLMKLDTIFEAMNWDVKEIGYQPTPKMPKIKAETPQIKVKRVKPIERPQEVEKVLENGKIGINVLSLFDGISCGQVALERAGIKVNKYLASEIDKYAIKIAMKNYPNTIQLGDIIKIKGNDLPKIDLLMGGSPCQGFSLAGKGLNFDDPRSKLFFEFVRLLKECKPTYFLFENVRMKQEWQDIITKYLKIEPIMINSALVSAQQRKRLYWTNIPNITQPKDKKLVLRDIILEKGIKEERTFLKGNFQKYMLDLGITKFFGEKGNPVDITMKEITTRANKYRVKHVMPLEGKARCLTTSCQYMTGTGGTGLFINGVHRNLDVIECERLQTIPDNYTEGIPMGMRYKALGNGWTVDVISHIFSFISNFVDKEKSAKLTENKKAPKTDKIEEIKPYYVE